MTEPRPEQFHIVLRLDAKPPIGTLARRLAPLFEMPHHDLALRLRYGGGWVARAVSGELADAIEDVLVELEVPAHRVPAASAPEVPTPVQVARSVHRRAGTVHFDAGLTTEELPLEQLRFVDLVALGELADDREDARGSAPRDPLLSQVRLIVEALPTPWPHQRLAFLDQRDHVQPLAHLIFEEPRRVLRIERGTTFPGSSLQGGQPWINHFLAFIDGLLADLPATHVVPAAAEFWSGAPLESILIGKPEELEQRLSWLEILLGLPPTPLPAAANEE